MFVQPRVEVGGVEPEQPADPHSWDAALLDQSTDVPDARAEQLGHLVDVEQPPPIKDRSDGVERKLGRVHGCHRPPYRPTLRLKRDEHDAETPSAPVGARSVRGTNSARATGSVAGDARRYRHSDNGKSVLSRAR